MGLSSNQARFLSLTSRQIDMEQRIQQICQRRLRLSSELENVATSYNNSISNRKMFSASQTNNGIQNLTVKNLEALGYKVLGLNSNMTVKDRPAIAPVAGQITINSQEEFLNLVSQMNSGTGLNNKYILNCDIDLSNYDTQGKSLIDGVFTGTFDGNGHTIDNLKIDTGGSGNAYIGMFSQLKGSASVSNLALIDCSINAAGSGCVGAIAGVTADSSIINNCYASGSINSYNNTGGIVGANYTTITNCTSDVDISGTNNLGGVVGSNNGTISNTVSLGNVTGTSPYDIGGFVGGNYAGHIENSSASGNVIGVTCVGGFAGTNSGSGTISNSFATGNVTAPWTVGGFAGNNFGTTNAINDCYAAGGIVSGNSSYGFSGGDAAATNSSNFYQNNMSSSIGASVNGISTTGWDTNIWDLSNGLPKLKSTGYTAYTDDLETGLRSGTYSLAKAADEYTQDPLYIGDKKYEEIDWRTAPEIYDELYKGDDAAAENKYDKTIDEINSQDKKLQLEQTSIETEYKAVTSEKEAVKKILDTNATSSFKYFS